jgi:hypothetical protein
MLNMDFYFAPELELFGPSPYIYVYGIELVWRMPT